MMDRLFLLLIFGAFFLIPNFSNADEEEVNHVLDALHQGAANADWKTYFSLFSKDAVFMGTDATERWSIKKFREYVVGRPTGWQYSMTERHINFTPERNAAWFDELLWANSYGQTRGTGVLIKTDMGWKISQYSLSITIPNDLADKLSTNIKKYLNKR